MDLLKTDINNYVYQLKLCIDDNDINKLNNILYEMKQRKITKVSIYDYNWDKFNILLLYCIKINKFESFKVLINNVYYKDMLLQDETFFKILLIMIKFIYESNDQFNSYTNEIYNHIKDYYTLQLNIFNTYGIKDKRYPELYKDLKEEEYNSNIIDHLINKDLSLSYIHINKDYIIKEINNINDFDKYELKFKQLIKKIPKESDLYYPLIYAAIKKCDVSKKDEYILSLNPIPPNMINYTDNIKVSYLIHKRIIQFDLYEPECDYLGWIDPEYYIEKFINKYKYKQGYNIFLRYLYNFTYDMFKGDAYKFVFDENVKDLLVYISPFIIKDSSNKISLKNFKYAFAFNRNDYKIFNIASNMLPLNRNNKLLLFISNWTFSLSNLNEESVICDYINYVYKEYKEPFKDITHIIDKYIFDNSKINIDINCINFLNIEKVSDETFKLIFEYIDYKEYLEKQYIKESQMIYIYLKYFNICSIDMHNYMIKKLSDKQLYKFNDSIKLFYNNLNNEIKEYLNTYIDF